jgi:rubrerythrin
MPRTTQDCAGIIHPNAVEGIRLFNDQKFFEAHEELEIAWNEERGSVRDLYRGILQVAVTCLHITRGNYDGAIKVHERSVKWLQGWSGVCRGIHVGKLGENVDAVMKEVLRLGKDGIGKFDTSLIEPILWNEKRLWICDRCGGEMREKNCKVTCPNCGNRFDCSDLNLYFD